MLPEHAESLEEIKSTLIPETGFGPGVFTYVCNRTSGGGGGLFSVGKGGRFAEAGMLSRKNFRKNKQNKARVTVRRIDFVKWLEEKLEKELEWAEDELNSNHLRHPCNWQRRALAFAQNIGSTEELYRSVITLLNDADGVAEEHDTEDNENDCLSSATDINAIPPPIVKTVHPVRLTRTEVLMPLEEYRKGSDKLTRAFSDVVSECREALSDYKEFRGEAEQVLSGIVEKHYPSDHKVMIATLNEDACHVSVCFSEGVGLNVIQSILDETGSKGAVGINNDPEGIIVSWSM